MALDHMKKVSVSRQMDSVYCGPLFLVPSLSPNNFLNFVYFIHLPEIAADIKLSRLHFPLEPLLTCLIFLFKMSGNPFLSNGYNMVGLKCRQGQDQHKFYHRHLAWMWMLWTVVYLQMTVRVTTAWGHWTTLAKVSCGQ